MLIFVYRKVLEHESKRKVIVQKPSLRQTPNRVIFSFAGALSVFLLQSSSLLLQRMRNWYSALGTLVTCPFQLSLLSPVTSTSALHSLVSNLSPYPTVSHLKMSTTFSQASIFPLLMVCFSCSFSSRASIKRNRLLLTSSYRCSWDCHLLIPWLWSSKALSDFFWVKCKGHFIPHLT